MARSPQRAAITDALFPDGVDIETVRIEGVTTGGHPDPTKCDLGFTVWVRGVDRKAAEAVARLAE